MDQVLKVAGNATPDFPGRWRPDHPSTVQPEISRGEIPSFVASLQTGWLRHQAVFFWRLTNRFGASGHRDFGVGGLSLAHKDRLRARPPSSFMRLQ